MEKYDPSKIEKKWQDEWERQLLYKADDSSDKEKRYILDMFPYPSGAGLHVGHVEGYTATDIYSRLLRMKGYSVLHPMGWDSFGLPAENYAIKTKVHPRVTTEEAITNFTKQIKSLGLSYDWSREIAAHRPEYYRWTQWFFLQLYNNGLAYRAKAKVNWCPKDQTVLANEQVVDGACERCGTEVIQKDLEQWFFKITKYADQLLEDLDTVDWPESTKAAQRNWIGRSEGAEIDFTIEFQIDPKNNEWRGEDGKPAHVTVFTTRPDTLFGATYLVLAPEHPWVAGALQYNRGVFENAEEVEAYVAATKNKTDLERSESKEKTGVELRGVKAINPANNEEVPVWIADYVIGSYGTGAIMAVPAHDERDFEFAKKMGIPMRQVIAPRLVQTTEPGAFKAGEPMVFRDGVIVLIKHWAEDKYLGLKWKEVAWGTLLTGGIEDGLSPEETVLKEIREETGYASANIVRSLGIVDGLFYHVPKKENRLVHGHVFYVELKNGDQTEVASDETSKHDVLWLTAEEMAGFLTAETHKYALTEFLAGERPYTGPGTVINSGTFTNLESEEAKKAIAESVGGALKVTYRLRDWLVSRQRYWGAPIPIIHCEKCGIQPVPESDLPVLLPEDVDFMPTGESPLARSESFHQVSCPNCGGSARRESDTMDTFVCSSWYYYRFADPKNAEAFASKDAIERWLPVDLYVGGAEHTVLHLLYARFFTKVLHELGYLNFAEPFQKLRHQGTILAEDGRKMSKSLGNTINPDDVTKQFGADTLRLYEMFMGPLEIMKPWNTQNIIGVRRFLERVWSLHERVGESALESETETLLHQTIAKVESDIENLKLNTAISQLMILVNALSDADSIPQSAYETLLLLLAPLAPHMTEELWHTCGHDDSIHLQSWPTYDAAKLVADTVTLAVQISGKTRTEIQVAPDADEETVREAAEKAGEKWLAGTAIKRVIYVPGRLINLVVA